MLLIQGDKYDDKSCDKLTEHNITQYYHHMINDKKSIPDKLILDLISRETNSLFTSYILRASAMIIFYKNKDNPKWWQTISNFDSHHNIVMVFYLNTCLPHAVKISL